MTGLTMESFRQGRFAKATAYFTTLMFTFVFYLSPTSNAIAQEVSEPDEAIVLKGTNAQKMNQGLRKLKEISAKKQAKISQRMDEEGGPLEAVLDFVGLSQLTLESTSEFETLSTLLAEEHATAMTSFADLEVELAAKNVSPEIMQRHHDAVAQYQTDYADMQQKLQAVLGADSLQEQEDATTALDTLMKVKKLKKNHQKVNPNKLPWGAPDASKTRKPGETAQELSSLTGISPLPQNTVMLAANTITPEMLGQLGGPVAEDLAETPDVQLTDAIRAKALELDDAPVKIYNWVRNNIEFIPSYGSIQGADYTLQHGKGNAFDTASLLIALYRAANIPARYAYGTVEIPAEKVMNWVGGVEVPEAAQQLLGQGGIPNVALINGGVITHIRMEHVWVEAWVDYFPSRGARHSVGDSWIPLDASFKQYDFTDGEDITANVPFDAQGLVDQIMQSATINDSEGFVQDVDSSVVETAMSNYQLEVESYINSQNPDATIEDVLGRQKIIIQEFQQLASGLPYRLQTRTHNYSELPGSLRHKFRYTLGTEDFGVEGSRLITFERSLPELAGKKHALSFQPSTQEDIDLIHSYLPEPDQVTGAIDPSQLPDNLPGYLINLTAEFTQNNEVVYSVEAGAMGTELYETLALWSPQQGWQQAINHPAAGEYRAIGLDLQGATVGQSISLQQELEATKSIFEGDDLDQITGLSKHKKIGDMLFSTIYSYLAVNDLHDRQQSSAAGVISYRLPSFGIFSTVLTTSYWFGLPRDSRLSGLAMDVDYLASQAVAKNNSSSHRIEYLKAAGARLSALEHIVPEQLLSTQDSSANGVSAVKAIAIASSEGQKIWTIDQGNVFAALASISLGQDIEDEITNSALSGKVITTHEQPINFAGGTNVGYIILDPETGAGAYRIASGGNGADVSIDAIKSFLLGILGDIRVGIADLAVGIFTNLITLHSACSSPLLYAFGLMNILLLSSAFAVGLLFPLLYGVIFAVIIGAVFRQLTASQVRLCSH